MASHYQLITSYLLNCYNKSFLCLNVAATATLKQRGAHAFVGVGAMTVEGQTRRN